MTLKTMNDTKIKRMRLCKYVCICMLGILTVFGVVGVSDIVHASSGPTNPMTSLKSVYVFNRDGKLVNHLTMAKDKETGVMYLHEQENNTAVNANGVIWQVRYDSNGKPLVNAPKYTDVFAITKPTAEGDYVNGLDTIMDLYTGVSYVNDGTGGLTVLVDQNGKPKVNKKCKLSAQQFKRVRVKLAREN